MSESANSSSAAGSGWSDWQVANHLCRVYEPPEPHPEGFALVYLQSVGQEDLADHPAITAEFAKRGLRVIAPQTGESWWSDRLLPEFDPQVTAERYVLDHVLPAMGERWGAIAPQAGLFGISMGGQGGLRLAYKHPDVFPVVAAIAPAIDFHLWLDSASRRPQSEIAPGLQKLYRDAEDARQDTATLHIHPLNWPRHQWFATDPTDHWHEGAERLRMKLASLGVLHHCDLETLRGGHSWDYFYAMTPVALDFVVEGLERERRKG